jgi:nucleoside-diphosphate-sugar epimerase
MKIAILGATSQIAKDLIISFDKFTDHELTLFSRDQQKLQVVTNALSLRYQLEGYDNFGPQTRYDVIINFIGVGSPVKAEKMGSNILEVTLEYDLKVLEYLNTHKDCRYIFLSSGAVFGTDFKEPVNSESKSVIPVNNLTFKNWYMVAKIYAEARHRALAHLNIVDVRVFNYFSHTQDMNSGFLITDIVSALKKNECLHTSVDNIVRDFITPPDFFSLIESIIQFASTNLALDCYTQSPVSKFDLLSDLQARYGLKYEVMDAKKTVNATGQKDHYYSLNKMAHTIGYSPASTSLEGINREISLLSL